MRAFPLCALVALLIAGCGSACRDLGDRICDCQPAGALRDSCKAGVNAQLGGSQRPDQSFCQAKLATCPDPTNDVGACDALQTAEGKAACGISYPPEG